MGDVSMPGGGATAAQAIGAILRRIARLRERQREEAIRMGRETALELERMEKAYAARIAEAEAELARLHGGPQADG